MEPMEEYRKFLKADLWKEWAKDSHETEQRKGIPRRPVQKDYPSDAKLIDLVPPEEFTVGKMPLLDVIRKRESRRKYTKESLTLEELSFLLWATQGVVRTLRHSTGLITRRTVPSGGSLHTFETYLFINRVDGLSPGLYRYLPLEHKLLYLFGDASLMEQVVAGCAGQQFVGGAAVVFIWTTIPARMEWRYTIVASKIIAQDSGHLCQNLYLACEAIGAGTCAIGAYDQKEMDAVLRVDGKDEFTVYVAPVGKIGE